MHSRWIGLLLVLGALSACTDVDRPPRWSYLHAAIIQPACTTVGCHSATSALAGVNLSGREGAYTILTGRICGEPDGPLDPPGNYVRPFSAGSSRLYHLLVGADTGQMPPDAPLPDVEIELIARWIDEGARCD